MSVAYAHVCVLVCGEDRLSFVLLSRLPYQTSHPWGNYISEGFVRSSGGGCSISLPGVVLGWHNRRTRLKVGDATQDDTFGGPGTKKKRPSDSTDYVHRNYLNRDFRKGRGLRNLDTH